MGQGKSAIGIVRKYHPNVRRVVDAKEPLRIRVTEDDCKKARRKAPDACAMAKACERKYDGAIISLATAYIIKGDKATRYHVPQSIARELISFDRHRQFAPGDYRLKAPTPNARLGSKKSTAGADRDRSRDSAGRRYGTVKRRSHKTAGIRAL